MHVFIFNFMGIIWIQCSLIVFMDYVDLVHVLVVTIIQG